jgi:hypothetical protein
MKTNTILFVTIAILLAIVIYLVLNTQVPTTVSREYVPVIYEDKRPRERVLLGSWGEWEFPTITWIHPPRERPAAPPPPPPSPVPPPAPPAEPPVEPPSAFIDMKKQEKEGFVSTAASYPFA